MPSTIEIEIKTPPCLSLSSIRNEPDDWAGCLPIEGEKEYQQQDGALSSASSDCRVQRIIFSPPFIWR